MLSGTAKGLSGFSIEGGRLALVMMVAVVLGRGEDVGGSRPCPLRGTANHFPDCKESDRNIHDVQWVGGVLRR